MRSWRKIGERELACTNTARTQIGKVEEAACEFASEMGKIEVEHVADHDPADETRSEVTGDLGECGCICEHRSSYPVQERRANSAVTGYRDERRPLFQDDSVGIGV